MFHTRCQSERITLFQLKYFILNVELHAPIYYLDEHVGISRMCGNLKSLVNCHKAVSYTHLDVYKRQVEALANKSGNPRFAWDSYRRFVQMYGDVVLGMKPKTKTETDPFEAIIDKVKEEKGVKFDTELEVEDLRNLVKLFKAAVKEYTGKDFPESAWDQLWGGICAV